MSRTATLPLTIYNHDFAALAKRETYGRTRIRLLGLAHIQEGKNYTEVASFLKVHVKSVMNWVKRFVSEGLDGIQEMPGRGAKRKLPWHLERKFEEAVLQAQAQRPGGRIKGKDIQKILAEEFGITCSLTTVYDTLKSLKLVWISARSKHPNHNQAAQDEFKKKLQAEGEGRDTARCFH